MTIALLQPQDVELTIAQASQSGTVFDCTIIDPWYNKGFGGTREDYVEYISRIVSMCAPISKHIYLWGFPEILCHIVPFIPSGLTLECWITWYYKNNPSVIRGWRSAQQSCLHLRQNGSRMYPEHFLNDRQLELLQAGKLRYIPGPPSVIEVPLNIGFVGRSEQIGHPCQKPEAVYERLILMATETSGTILDPMCGSGTTGAVAHRLGRNATLADANPEYVEMARRRLSNANAVNLEQVAHSNTGCIMELDR